MYNASDAFHTAAQGHEPQICLLIFSDAIFSNSDIDVSSGVEFHDYFNTEEDISIGQALSNEIRFKLFNDERNLNSYEFGEFKALIGVRTDTQEYHDTSDVYVDDGNVSWRGNSTTPYLTRSRVAVSEQPSFPVKSIIIYDGKVYAIGDNKQYKVYTTAGVATEDTMNAFMREKSQKYFGLGAALSADGKLLFAYKGGVWETYEFVPLGTFIAERPDSPDQISISISCHDRMTLFDKDMPTASQLDMTYPATIGQLFVKMCEYKNVPYLTDEFINSDAEIPKEPEAFKNANMRTVIGWIAEAAGSNAGFDRDGYLVMKWLNSTDLVLDGSMYTMCVPKYYRTPKVTKLCKRQTSSGDEDEVVGSGSSSYLIQDNPLM